jgi:oxalate decarboxylase/phosphoglucose isomerase-like protein (cupin superfamily)
MCLVSAAFAQVMDPDLVAKLKLAPTHQDRIHLLTDEQFVFNFLAGVGVTAGSGGMTTGANSGNFPAIIGNGMAMTIGHLEACGMNTPHVHPRATEFNLAVNGTLRTGMLAESGARFVTNEVPAGSATIFPRGAIHFEENLSCEPTLFVAAFNNEDPGNTPVAQRLFGVPLDIVAATFASIGVQEVAGLESKIPNNPSQGTEECLKRCGIKKVQQPTTQRQPRIASNPLPAGFSGPPPPPPPPPTPSKAAGAVNQMPGNNGTAKGAAASGNDGATSSPLNDKNVKPFLIALLTINGVFVVGTLTALFLYVARRRGSKPGRMNDSMVPQFAPLRDEKDTEYYDPYDRSLSPVSPEKR